MHRLALRATGDDAMSFNLADYTTVAERIKLFWEKNPDGAIKTTLLPSEPNVFIFRCELYRNLTDSTPFSIGHAREVAAERGVNRDFPLENCETSSIGIACKNAGIGTDKHGPSREEMQKVARVQTQASLKDEGYSNWDIGRIAATGNTENSDEPKCKHGFMQLRKGISEKTGNEYYGYVCTNTAEPCPAEWYELGPNGQWRKRVRNG